METCANCAAELTGPYCSTCGSKRLSAHDFSLRHFFAHVLHDLTHFDAKIFSSLVPLLLRPGFLTAEYMAGKWTRYIKPTTLFILINVFFFFAKGGIFNWNADEYIRSAGARATVLVEQRAADRNQSLAAYKDDFTAVAKQVQHSMFFFVIPAVGVSMLLLFRRRYLVEHLVYSIHFHAFLLIFLTLGIRLLFQGILVPLTKWGILPVPYFNYLNNDPGLTYVMSLPLTIYQFLALRRVYHVGPLRALATAVALTAGEAALIVYVYQPLVFYWVYYTA